MKKISNCDYLVESIAGKHIKTIVHFNRLKLCKPGMRFQRILNDNGELSLNADPVIGQQPKAASHLLGEHLELVDTDNMTTIQPNRVCQPPSGFADFVSH